jgi:Protein of unknown function (DUF4254)
MSQRQLPLLGAEVLLQHDALNRRPDWPDFADPVTAASHWAPALRQAVLDNHHNNARLWCEEDLARRTRAPDAEIVANKRQIDAFNQARNNAIERIDEWLLLQLGLVDAESAATAQPLSLAPEGARLNSETGGSMVDRLSILSLKCKAMGEQVERADVDEAHRRSARERLARLEEQRDDLRRCLDELLADSLAGRAYFKVYRQFKMYNDPAFNPALVRERQGPAG